MAWKGKELVGMTNFEKCIDGSGWLSMARTDPSWRRSGVALFLQRQIAARAQRKGITTLRLWASSKNKPSISAIRKGGFKQVCEAAHISYYSRAKGKRTSTRPINNSSRTELEPFLRSKYLSQMNGYLAYDWHFVKANTELLKLLRRRKELYSVGDTVFIQTRPERIFGRLETGLALLAGPFTDSLRNAKQVARGVGAQNVGGYIPHNKYLLRASRRLGDLGSRANIGESIASYSKAKYCNGNQSHCRVLLWVAIQEWDCCEA